MQWPCHRRHFATGLIAIFLVGCRGLQDVGGGGLCAVLHRVRGLMECWPGYFRVHADDMSGVDALL